MFKTINVSRGTHKRFVTIAGIRHTVIGVRANELLVRHGISTPKWVNPKSLPLDNLLFKLSGVLVTGGER